jgi:hypothetical protein
MDISPGATVSVEIAEAPKSAAAQKTLVRVCSKDPQVARQHRTRKEKRPSRQDWIRGGRFWNHRMKSRPAVKLDPGMRYTVHATVDVIRDLQSIERYVKVSAAKTG